ncbi:ABC transporter permease [Rhodanobacter denitrificans]|uniref:Transport permease protein n=1 Tax=Rhodanobacter denitrificans TaxID=666685 RepID=A0A368KI08_9GAMM|nr:ABC transporter permease [Rhodanobacter denitrificans]RCS31540.1 ABC transporter permease [Rhodanobacter denitrificans]
MSMTDNSGFLRGLLAPYKALTSRRTLTFELTKRDILGRYRGASFGLFWSLLSPFLMLLIYTFAFGFVFKSKWPHEVGGDHPYAIILYMGLIVHGFFSECLTRSPTLVTSNTNLVKRVVFPLEILPWPVMLSALFHVGMNLLVFAVLRLALEHTLCLSMLWLPVVFLPMLPLTLGVCWLFASFGVYLRDVSQITGVLSTAMLFVSSAMIPVNSLPSGYRVFFEINPLTFIIDQARVVALAGHVPDFAGLAMYGLAALVFMYVGYAWFMLTRRGFADVL